MLYRSVKVAPLGISTPPVVPGQTGAGVVEEEEVVVEEEEEVVEEEDPWNCRTLLFS